MTLPALATFWHGERLSGLEMAPLHSFRELGHFVTVYSCASVANLPQGVVAGNANAIFPAERILKHRRHKSPAIHADLLRHAMLARTGQIWLDLDLIALRPLDFEGAHVFGWETEWSVNNAVLCLPAGSPTLARLREFCLDTRGVPQHVKGLRHVKHSVRTFGPDYRIEDWLRGSTGPRALIIYLKGTGEVRHALPVEAFYPVGATTTAPCSCRGSWPRSTSGLAPLPSTSGRAACARPWPRSTVASSLRAASSMAPSRARAAGVAA